MARQITQVAGASSVAASTALAALLVAWLTAQGRPTTAAAALLAPPLLIAVLAKPPRAFLLAIWITVLLPFTMVVGVAQASIPRLAAMAAVGSILLAGISGRRATHVRRHPLDFVVGAFALVVIASWATDDPLPNSLQHALNYVVPILFYAAARWFAEDEILAILWSLLLGGALASLTIYYEYLVTKEPLFVDTTSYYWSASAEYIFRPAGVFGSPPAAGTVLAMTLLASLPLLTRSAGRIEALAWAAFALSAGALFLTFTRGPMVGFAVGFLVYLALAKPAWRGRFTYGLVIAALAVFLLVLPRVAGARWYEEGVLRAGTFETRQSFWAQSLPLVTNSYRHLIGGHGINSLIVGRANLPGQVDPDIATVPFLTQNGPHNQYVRTALEQGLTGLAILVAWLGGTLWFAARAVRRLPGRRALIAGSAAGVASLLVVSFVNDSLRHPPTLAIGSLLSGLIVTLGAGTPVRER